MKPKPKTKRRPNYRLLRQIRDEILKEPLRLDMNAAVYIADDVAPCGTTACIAGFALMDREIRQRKVDWKKAGMCLVGKLPMSCNSLKMSWRSAEPRARRLLGLNFEQSESLFHVRNWPMDFRIDYYTKENTRIEAAKIAAARINFFIKTKGTDRE